MQIVPHRRLVRCGSAFVLAHPLRCAGPGCRGAYEDQEPDGEAKHPEIAQARDHDVVVLQADNLRGDDETCRQLAAALAAAELTGDDDDGALVAAPLAARIAGGATAWARCLRHDHGDAAREIQAFESKGSQPT